MCCPFVNDESQFGMSVNKATRINDGKNEMSEQMSKTESKAIKKNNGEWEYTRKQRVRENKKGNNKR